jgi:hypothetical protein
MSDVCMLASALWHESKDRRPYTIGKDNDGHAWSNLPELIRAPPATGDAAYPLVATTRMARSAKVSSAGPRLDRGGLRTPNVRAVASSGA